MAERTQRIDLILKTIPNFNGNVNELNSFISAVNLVHDVLGTLKPQLDAFELSTTFLYIRSRVTGKALQNIKDLNIRSWPALKETLLNSFSDRSNSVTILNSILNIKNIRSSPAFIEIVKTKFNKFKSRLYVENDNSENRRAITDFVEKLIITHFITNLIDPFRNNLATRNPRSLEEIERLVKYDLQYLKPDLYTKNSANEQNNHYAPRMKSIRNQFGQFRTPIEILVILLIHEIHLTELMFS